MIPRILAIAGSDSGGGAGIQADLKTITMLGGHAMTAVTAITAQNTLGVAAVLPIPPATVVAQIDAAAGDIGVDAIKIGMIGSPAVADAVADRLAQHDLADVPVVFDPVMVATTGAILADAATRRAFARLLARATVTTPNLDELAALAGRAVEGAEDVAAAATHLIAERRAHAVLATGVRLDDTTLRHPGEGRDPAPTSGARASVAQLDPGLRRGDGEGRVDELADLLFTHHATAPRIWRGQRIDTDHDHGTGCTLSSAIAEGLGRGLALTAAIERARAYVRAALTAAPGLGGGRGPMGHGLGRAWPDGAA